MSGKKQRENFLVRPEEEEGTRSPCPLRIGIFLPIALSFL